MALSILITANLAGASPQGTVIKEGALTYPAGHYLAEDPLLLSLENYGKENNTQTPDKSYKIDYLENEYPFFENNTHSIIHGDPDAWNSCTYVSNLYSIYYNPYKELLHPDFFLLCYTSSLFSKKTLSISFSATFQ